MASRKKPTALMAKRVQARVKAKFGRLKCEHCKQNYTMSILQYAHKDRRNYHTVSTNFILLCPTCHKKYDNKVTVRSKGTGLLGATGRRVTRVKKKPAKKKTTKKRRRKVGFFGI